MQAQQWEIEAQANLDYLEQAQDEVCSSSEERRDFEQYFMGAMATDVPGEIWRSCVDAIKASYERRRK